jgi:hypothetical protein
MLYQLSFPAVKRKITVTSPLRAVTVRVYHNSLILYIRKDGEVTRTLNSGSQLSLMLRAIPCNSPRKDLAALRDISLQLIDILVADLTFFSAENAYFLPSVETAFSSETAFAACFLKCRDNDLLFSIRPVIN